MAGCFDLDCTNLVALVKLVLRLGFTAIGLRILEQTDFIDKEFWSTRPTLWPGRAGRAAYHQVRVLPALESRAARAHFGSRAQEPYCHFLVTSLQQRIQAARLHNITRGPHTFSRVLKQARTGLAMYMDGAVRSGQRVALTILETL